MNTPKVTDLTANAQKISHEERKKRREDAAEFIKAEILKNNTNVIKEASTKFGLSPGYLVSIIKSHGIKIPSNIKKIKPKISKRAEAAKELLINSSLNLTEIAQKVKMSKERIRQIKNDLIKSGLPVQERNCFSRHTSAEEEFIAIYKATGSFIEARKKANIALARAKYLLEKENSITHPPPDYNFNKKNVSKNLYILADLFNESLTLKDIATKHNTYIPLIYNMVAAAKYVGIPIPDRVDGRVTALSILIKKGILLYLQENDGAANSRNINKHVRDSLETHFQSYPNAKLQHILNESINFSIIRQKNILKEKGLIAIVSTESISQETITYSLTNQGWHEAAFINDEIISEIIEKVKADYPPDAD